MDHEWIACSNGNVPLNAVEAGREPDDHISYVGRCKYKGDMLPAKILPCKKIASMLYMGEEIEVKTYEALSGLNYTWTAAANGEVPSTAVKVGKTAVGEILFAGRCTYQKCLVMGKVQPSHGGLYISYACAQIHFEQYEVLTRPDQWISTTFESMPNRAFIGGWDADNDHIYVGRVCVADELIPAAVIPKKDAAYVEYGNTIQKVDDFQVLVGYSYKWIKFDRTASISSRAVPGGKTSDGETLYIGRAMFKDSALLGKILPSYAFVNLCQGDVPADYGCDILVRI